MKKRRTAILPVIPISITEERQDTCSCSRADTRWSGGSALLRTFPLTARELLSSSPSPCRTPPEESNALSRFLLRGGSVLAVGILPDAFVRKAAATEGEIRGSAASNARPWPRLDLTRGGSISLDGDSLNGTPLTVRRWCTLPTRKGTRWWFRIPSAMARSCGGRVRGRWKMPVFARRTILNCC